MSKFHKITLGIIAVLMLLAPVMAFAQVTDADRADSKYYIHPVADQLSVGTSITTYTDTIALTNSEHHGLWVRTSSVSSGGVDYDITAEYSINRNSGFAAVTTPTEIDTISDLGSKPVKLTSLCFMPFIRFKLVSGATNAADVKADIFLVRDSKQK